MGGSSSSSSSSSSTTTNEDNRVAVEQGAIGIGAGATVTVTDGGILEGAGDLVNSFGGVLESGFASLADQADEFAAFATDAVTQANALALERQEGDTKEIAETTIKGVLLATVGMGAILGLALFWGRK